MLVLKPMEKAIADNDHIYSAASPLSTLCFDYVFLPSLKDSWELDQL